MLKAMGGVRSAAKTTVGAVKSIGAQEMRASGLGGAVQGVVGGIKEVAKKSSTSEFASQHLATIRNSMGDLGPQGKQLADDLLGVEVRSHHRLFPQEAKLRAMFKDAKPADKEAVIDWLDNESLRHKGLKTRALNLTEEQVSMANSFKQILSEGSDEARALGLQVHKNGATFAIGKNDYGFFPNQLNPNMTAKQMDFHASRMVAEGTVGDIVQAKAMIQQRLQGRNYIFGPQERGRLVNPTGYKDRVALGYKVDPYEVATHHLAGKFDTIGLANRYGIPAKGSDYPPGVEKIFRDMDAVTPGSGEKISRLYRAQVGLDKAPYSRAVSEVKAATNLVSLFGLPIQQAFEVVSAMPDAGIARVVKMAYRAAKNPAVHDEGTPASVMSRILHSGHQTSMLGPDIETAGTMGKLFQKTLSTPISAMDRFSRDVAYMAFRESLDDAVKATSKSAKQKELLKRSGLTGTGTAEELDRAATTLVMQQFPGVAKGSHIAGQLTSNTGKLMHTYQAYSLDRMREIMRMAKTPERVPGLATLLAGYAASGKAQMAMKEAVGLELPVPDETTAEHWARAIRMGSFTPYQVRVLNSLESGDVKRLVLGASLAKGAQLVETLGTGEFKKALTLVAPVGGHALRRNISPTQRDVMTAKKLAIESGKDEDIKRYLETKMMFREQRKN